MVKTAIDYSHSNIEPKYVFALVSTADSMIPKLSNMLINQLSIKHWAKLRKIEKSHYADKFLRKWDDIKEILYRVDIKFYFDDIIKQNKDIINNSTEIIIDDTIFSKYLRKYEGKGKLILEKDAQGFRKAFIDLADNICNIVRWLWNKKDNYKKQIILEKFIK
ncbi:hypothetical protein YN1_4720 [Nanoarchaeota archaeon]